MNFKSLVDVGQYSRARTAADAAEGMGVAVASGMAMKKSVRSVNCICRTNSRHSSNIVSCCAFVIPLSCYGSVFEELEDTEVEEQVYALFIPQRRRSFI